MSYNLTMKLEFGRFFSKKKEIDPLDLIDFARDYRCFYGARNDPFYRWSTIESKRRSFRHKVMDEKIEQEREQIRQQILRGRW